TATIIQINGTAITAGGPGVTVDHGTVTLGANNALTFTPNADYNGPSEFSYTLAKTPATDPANITANVSAVADIVAAVVNPNEFTVDSFHPVRGLHSFPTRRSSDLTATIIQINGTAITAGGPGVTVDHGTVTLGANNALTFTPNADYNGPS